MIWSTYRVHWCNQRNHDHDNASSDVKDWYSPLQRVRNSNPWSSPPCTRNIGSAMFHGICMPSTCIYYDIWTWYIWAAACEIICSTSSQKESVCPYNHDTKRNLQSQKKNLRSMEWKKHDFHPPLKKIVKNQSNLKTKTHGKIWTRIVSMWRSWICQPNWLRE